MLGNGHFDTVLICFRTGVLLVTTAGASIVVVIMGGGSGGVTVSS